MKNYILFISLFFPCFIPEHYSGQNYRFYYNFTYKMDTLGSTSKDLLVLSVTDQENIFLSSRFIEIDSINSLNQHQKQYINPQYNSILRCIKEKELFSSYKKLDMEYYHYDFKKKLHWSIHPEKKDILNFKVQKATTSYGGRNWIAWFCTDIQLSYGPYVFYGLPGLILEVYDDENNFHYTLVKSTKILDHHFKLDSIFEDPPVKIAAQDWKKI